MHYAETSKSCLHELGHPHFIKQMQSAINTCYRHPCKDTSSARTDSKCYFEPSYVEENKRKSGGTYSGITRLI